MGVIQNSVNQALGIGALAAGKWRTDYNNSVIASENIDTKRRQELYNKEQSNGLNLAEKEAQKELNNKFADRVNKYAGPGIWKNADLRRYYESQNVDRNIALDQIENNETEIASSPIVSHTQEDPEYEKATEAQINEYMNQPSIQQVMAEEQANRIDEMMQFKADTKELLGLRKDVISGRLKDLNIRPKVGYRGRHKQYGTDYLTRNKFNPTKDSDLMDEHGYPTMKGLEWAYKKTEKYERNLKKKKGE